MKNRKGNVTRHMMHNERKKHDNWKKKKKARLILPLDDSAVFIS